MTASVVAVRVEVIAAGDGQIYCECGCGQVVCRAECVVLISGHPYRPYEIIYKPCLEATYGKEDVEKHPSAMRQFLTLLIRRA